MMAHNLCWSTLITEAEILKHKLVEGLHFSRVPDFNLSHDGNVISKREASHPCFLNTQEDAHKAAVAMYDLKEGIHYKTKLDKKITLIANGDTVFALQKNNVLCDVHYSILNNNNTEEKEIVFTVCKKGVLPIILHDLISKRAAIKAQMKACSDPKMYGILDARQLALKMLANSMYGATGATRGGYLPQREVAESVTRYGRAYILTTSHLITSHFNKKNGFCFDTRIVYGDTDSVFVHFINLVDNALKNSGDKINWELLYDVSFEMADYVTKNIGRHPISLTFEKIFDWIILVSNKRYAGHKKVITKTKEGGFKEDHDFHQSGLESVRRDSCQLVSETVAKVLELIVMKKDVKEAVQTVRSTVGDLLLGNISYYKLIISRGLSRKTEDYKSKLAHVRLAEKITKRDPNNAYRVGDRIKYVVVPGTKKGEKVSNRAEDPMFAFENCIDPDYNWYLQNQLMKPLQRIFFYVFKNKEVVEQLAFEEKDAEWAQVFLFDKLVLQRSCEEIEREEAEFDREEIAEEAENNWIQEGDELLYEIFNKEKKETFITTVPTCITRTTTITDPTSQCKKQKLTGLSAFLGKNLKDFVPPTATSGVAVSSVVSSNSMQNRGKKRKTLANSIPETATTLANNILFMGSHTKNVKIQPSMKKGAIGTYFAKVTKCVVCGHSTQSNTKNVCDVCDVGDPGAKLEKITDAILHEQQKLKQSKVYFAECMKKCSECTAKNPDIDLETCKNVDCENLFERMKSKKAITSCMAKLALDCMQVKTINSFRTCTPMNDHVDFVYTYVNGSTSDFLTDLQNYKSAVGGVYTLNEDIAGARRFRDWEEILYSLRSVDMYAPWVHKVWIIVSDGDHQVPSWLSSEHSQMAIVKHSMLFVKSNNENHDGVTSPLPNFNSNAIECNLHLIDGLAQHWIYMNNDMFLSSKLEACDFFPVHGVTFSFTDTRLVSIGAGHNSFLPSMTFSVREQSLQYSAQLLMRNIPPETQYKWFIPFHAPAPILLSVVKEMWNLYNQEQNETSYHRFRHPCDCSFIYMYHQYAEYIHKSAIKRSYEQKSMKFVRISDNPDNFINQMQKIRLDPPQFFTLNDDTVNPSASLRSVIKFWLSTMFPTPSRWELL